MASAKSSSARRRRRWWVFSNEEKKFWIFGLVMGLVIVYVVFSTVD